MITRNNGSIRSRRGFSLIEVMVAVVVLSTGLLALAALQANLVRSAADSKARSRVAALVSSHLDAMRAGGYDGAASMPATGCVGGNDVCQAQTEGAIGGLTIAHQVAEVLLPGSTARYKTVRMVAQWTDAAGQARTLSMNTVLSPTALDSSPTLVDKDLSGDSAKQPIVRTTNPATPGMIPIAVSATDSTAATNPRPELLAGQGNKPSVTGTKFDVLTYTNETSGNAQIQRRVETTVIACTCKYGAGGDNLPEISRTAQWPAVWTGERYEIYKPDGAINAPGQAAQSGPASGVTQSPLCTECCRDHHDTSASGVVKFDPERVLTENEAVHSHYRPDQSGGFVLAVPGNGDVYKEACRMIRVDGLWRTAADMYSRYTGLIATGTASDKTDPATTGVPDATAAENYGGNVSKGINGFVKDYLSELFGTASSSVGAATLYANYGLDNPTVLTIRRPEDKLTDERYLHLRGLYVDHLEEKAQEKIENALLPANCQQTNKAECILPYIPFTTINLTELAYWKAQVFRSAEYTDDNNILSVLTASPVLDNYQVTQPYRGRTNALNNANNTDEAYAVASVTKSNSGVATLQQGIDEDDDALPVELPDRQLFRIQASGGGNTGTDRFWVNLAGHPRTSDTDTQNDPKVNWTIGTSVDKPCGGTIDGKVKGKVDDDPNNYACNNTPTLPQQTIVTLRDYGVVEEASASFSTSCTYQATTQPVSGPAMRPYFVDYQVTAASVGGVSANQIAVSSSGTLAEATALSFDAMPSQGLVSVTFVQQGTTLATIASCTAVAVKDKKGNITGYTFGTITWNKPWE
jgi:prepilin-type N-terminal cleavage/methylation domain-containing protein